MYLKPCVLIEGPSEFQVSMIEYKNCVCILMCRASIILFCVCEGGATPGKLIMGLKIVKCNQIVPLGINRVQVGSLVFIQGCQQLLMCFICV